MAEVRFLVVDDDALLGRALARQLQRDPVHVTVETSPAAALALLTAGEGFDVVLCDVMMPEMTGPELFERAVASRPSCREIFFFMTGGVEPAMWRELEATGRPCLPKPVSPATALALAEAWRRLQGGQR